jgi:protein-S-isoprenylcysteine O-methyltransferase Ste14
MGVVLIQIQVRLEEDFLVKNHGVEYEQYRRQVRRWI